MKGRLLLLVAAVLLVAMPVYAGVNLTGCLNSSTSLSTTIYFAENVTTGIISTVVFNDDCNNIEVIYDDVLNLTFGDILPGEVVSGADFVYVDSVMRPDLDAPATLKFKNQRFVTTPDIYRDGVICADDVCVNSSYVDREYVVRVPGFSNYSLQSKKEFLLYSDDKPYVRNKIYQSVDLGDAYRADLFSCVVQIYGYDDNGDLVLVRADPERRAFNYIVAQDTNQPESLGYFPVVGGLANVYFTDEKIYGYFDYEYVLECTSNATSLFYEEPLSTMYDRAGRTLEARAMWLARGSNAFYLVISAVLLLIVFWLLMLFIRRVR
jgi:hypothetical protein